MENIALGDKITNISGYQEDSHLFTEKDFSKNDFNVIYFYPKDATPICTNEAIEFQKYIKEFTDLKTEVWGVSADDKESHKNFIEKHNLSFHLIVDEGHKLHKTFGAYANNRPLRHTFLISKDGTLLKAWRDVKIPEHIQEVLSEIKQAKK